MKHEYYKHDAIASRLLGQMHSGLMFADIWCVERLALIKEF